MKKRIRITESALRQIVKESVKKILKESKGLEPGKRDKEFASMIKWGGEPDLDKANEWRKSQHYSSRGKKKVKGDTSTRDLFRSENEKGNFVHKLKTNPEEWVENMCKKSLKEMDESQQNRNIYVGNVFTVHINNGKIIYDFDPPGWYFNTMSQLEAASICATGNKSFMKNLAESELNIVPLTNPTQDDIIEALFWLTGGNREWYHGYWIENGVEWGPEAIERLLSDKDIMQIINNTVSSSNNFLELVVNLRKSITNDPSIFVHAADALADLMSPYDEEDDEN